MHGSLARMSWADTPRVVMPVAHDSEVAARADRARVTP
jgi:hypothetical protein